MNLFTQSPAQSPSSVNDPNGVPDPPAEEGIVGGNSLAGPVFDGQASLRPQSRTGVASGSRSLSPRRTSPRPTKSKGTMQLADVLRETNEYEDEAEVMPNGTSAPAPGHQSFMEGWIHRQTTDAHWVRRWLVLEDIDHVRILSCYLCQDKQKHTKSMLFEAVRDAELIFDDTWESTERPPRARFTIHAQGGHDYNFEVDDMQEAKRWVNLLKQQIEIFRNAPPSSLHYGTDVDSLTVLLLNEENEHFQIQVVARSGKKWQVGRTYGDFSRLESMTYRMRGPRTPTFPVQPLFGLNRMKWLQQQIDPLNQWIRSLLDASEANAQLRAILADFVAL